MGSHDPESKAERLLEEARRLASHTRPPAERRDGSETAGSFAQDLRFFRRTLANLREGWLAFSGYIVYPVSFVLGPPLRWMASRYRSLWLRCAYRTKRESGERVLSRRRAGAFMSATALVVLAFTPTAIGNTIRFFTIEPVLDGFLIGTSLRTEIFYLNNSEEVDPEENIHAVRGCHNAGQCNEYDAVYLRVRPRLAHDFWKLWTYGNPIYVPDHVVAPIAPGVNRCSVTYYGYRITSSWIARILRSLQLYPTMLEASCTHLGNREQVQDSAVDSEHVVPVPR